MPRCSAQMASGAALKAAVISGSAVPAGTTGGVLHPGDGLMALPAPLMEGETVACVTSPWERCSARIRPETETMVEHTKLWPRWVPWSPCLFFSMRSQKGKQGLISSSSKRCLQTTTASLWVSAIQEAPLALNHLHIEQGQ